MVLECLLGHMPLEERTEGGKEEPLPGPEDETAQEPAHEGPRVVYLDLETQMLAQEVGGWRNTHLMRVSVAVAFDSTDDCFYSYTEGQMEDLLDLLERADLVVGFNIKRFDYGVLGAYSAYDLKGLNTFDMLEDVHRRLGFRLSLDHLAKETLGRGKTADGLQAVDWFRQGEMELLTEYCREDVAVTRDLFLYGMNNGHLIYRQKKEDRRVRLLVDWDMDALIRPE
jgi:DEAD/DEAH box helicase domain-containing protein